MRSSRSGRRCCTRATWRDWAWQPGDVVTIESRRGEVACTRARDDGTPPGAVFVPFCYYEAAVNLLTNAALDPFGKIPEFKYCAVRISVGGPEPTAATSSYGGGRILAEARRSVNLRAMHARGVHLEYSFQPDGQHGADVHNPLFELLSAVREHGSIQHAAKAMGASYRHVWGALKHWEGVLGEPLVSWSQGQPARLTPFAQRMVWAEARARARLAPHIEALRVELERVLSDALDGTQQVFTLYASHDLALPLLRERAGAEHRLHVELKFAGSVDALRALADGRCVVAGFHVPRLPAGGKLFEKSLKPLLKPGLHKLIGCATRRQGLIVARGNPLGSGVAARPGARGRALRQSPERLGHSPADRPAAAERGIAPETHRRLRGGAPRTATLRWPLRWPAAWPMSASASKPRRSATGCTSCRWPTRTTSWSACATRSISRRC